MGPIAWTAGDGAGAGAGATGTGVPSIEGCDDGPKVAVTRAIRVGCGLGCLAVPIKTATTRMVARSASDPNTSHGSVTTNRISRNKRALRMRANTPASLPALPEATTLPVAEPESQFEVAPSGRSPTK